jgi:hypothetical protein
MKRMTLGLVLTAAALLSGCIVVPARPYGRYYGAAHVTVVDSPRYGGYERGGYDHGRDDGPRRGW